MFLLFVLNHLYFISKLNLLKERTYGAANFQAKSNEIYAIYKLRFFQIFKLIIKTKLETKILENVGFLRKAIKMFSSFLISVWCLEAMTHGKKKSYILNLISVFKNLSSFNSFYNLYFQQFKVD